MSQVLNDSEKEQLLREFYTSHLLPLVTRAEERKHQFLVLDTLEDTSTYYKNRVDDGQYLHEVPAAEIGARLSQYWQQDDFPELATLADPLLELAKHLSQTDEATGDVPQFIYAMF